MPSRSESLESAFRELREMLSGAALRAVAGIRDVGEVLVAVIGDDTASGHDVRQERRDAWVRFTDVFSGLVEVGRLYAPAGLLWRQSKKGQGAHVIRGRNMRGPGGALVIPDGGDGRTNDVVPAWLSEELAGISCPEGFQIESTGDQVVIKSKASGSGATVTLRQDGSIEIDAAAGADVTINGGARKAARVSDPLAVGMLSGVAGPWPVTFTYVPMRDVGGVDTPDAPSVGPLVTLSGIVSNGGGAPHVKE